MSLEDLRNRLSAIDGKLIDLVAERQRLVGEIGQVKLNAGRATRDYERERVVLEAVRAQAASLEIDPRLADEILTALIRSSLTRQEHDRVVAEGRGDGQSVLVIGGGGKMGGWFVDFFTSQGYRTTIADIAATPGDRHFADWRQAGIDFEIIVLATPLHAANDILVELAALRPRGLVFDIGSLKTPVKEGLRALAAAGCQVASLHPMFGPGTGLLSGKHLVFVDAGVPAATAAAKALFAATMVEQLDMGMAEHDRLIAYVLGLSHALNIAFFTALADSGEAATQLARLSSTTFDAQMLVAAAVARDNPHLYYEIQHLNEFGMASLEALENAVAKVRSAVASGDENAFVELMRHGRVYLAERG
jgi:chorismate mutase/prephenate dehydrogenase